MTKQHRIKSFSTVTELLKACSAEPTFTLRRTSHSAERASWLGSKSYEEAENLASCGWDKGLKEITERLASIPKECEGRVVMKDIAGSHPDVARFVAGMPDCMNRRVVSDAARKPCLDIVVNASYSGATDVNDIINYGSAIASHIDELENSGYSISLAVAYTSETCRTQIAQGCMLQVKKHGEPLDLGKLVFFVAHPSAYRRIGFAYWETTCTNDELASSYGHCLESFPESLRGDLFFGDVHPSCRTVKKAMDYVRKIINAQMPELFTGGQRAA